MSGILCADIGTTSLKTAIINGKGEVVSFCAKPISNFHNCKKSLSNKTIQKQSIAHKWEECFFESINELCAQGKINFCELEGICISANGPTIVSDTGKTLLWNEKPKNEPQQNESIQKEIISLFLPRILLFRDLYPTDFYNAKYLFGAAEYLIYKLTGTAITILPEARFESAYWNDSLLKKYNIPCDKMPPFVKIAHKAGIYKGVPVFCGGLDFTSALIGTNTLSPGKLCDRAGSSEGINLCVEKQIFAKGLRTFPSVIENLWNLSIVIPKSGILLDSFRNDINELEKTENSYDQIIDFLFNDKNSEGYRILLELSNDVKTALEKLKSVAKQNNIPMENTMNVTGGQAKSEKWLKEKAHLVKTDLAVCNTQDAELLGNAIIAYYALGKYPSIKKAADDLVKLTSIFKSTSQKAKPIKIHKIPKDLQTIIFDIDSTLYTNPSYAIEQVDCQIRFFAKECGISESQARNQISEFRKKYFIQNGRKISLANTLTHFGISIEKSIEMRRNLLEPKNFLSYDARLVKTIKALSKKYKIICVTNNPVLPAKKTLEALGIATLIPKIIGLDTCQKSKPAIEPFQKACELTQTAAKNCISIGDRYDIDLALPLEMGMGAIEVNGVEDVYKLPEILN